MKIRENELKNLDDAYNRALRLEMIRLGSQRKDQVDSPDRRERNVRVVEADVSRSALNDEFQKKLEGLQAKNLKKMEEVRRENKRTQKRSSRSCLNSCCRRQRPRSQRISVK